MIYALAADAVLALHLAFIVWVAVGGAAALWRPWLAWLHLPAAAWGVFVSLSGRLCPLTPLEQWLRVAAGEQGYAGGFIDHYLIALVYPSGLTRDMQIGIGLFVVSLNVGLYGWLLYRRRLPCACARVQRSRTSRF